MARLPGAHPWFPRPLIIGLLIACAATLVACDGFFGSDGDDGRRSELEGLPQEVPVLTIEAALDQDIIELAELTRYQDIECAAEPEGEQPPPVCRPEEEPGTPVQVFPVAECMVSWTRPEDVPPEYERVFGEEPPELVAVYVPSFDPLFLAADYAVVLRTPGAAETDGVVLWIVGGRVLFLEHACNGLEALYEPGRVESFVIEPE